MPPSGRYWLGTEHSIFHGVEIGNAESCRSVRRDRCRELQVSSSCQILGSQQGFNAFWYCNFDLQSMRSTHEPNISSGADLLTAKKQRLKIGPNTDRHALSAERS